MRLQVNKGLWVAASLLVAIALLVGGCHESSPEQQPPPVSPPPVSAVLPAEHPTDFPKNLRWLTEEEKDRVIEIALSTSVAVEWRQKESQYKTSIGWIALEPNSEGEGYSSYWTFEYEIVEKGIPRGTVDVTPPGSPEKIVSVGVPEEAEIYPNVTIWFGEPAEWVVLVAVDLEAGRVVYDEDYPNLSNPNRFRSLTGGN